MIDNGLEYYMTFNIEKVVGKRYEQNVDRVLGKEWIEYSKDSYIYNNWAKIYWESHKFNNALKYCNYESDKWSSTEVKDKALSKIYDFIKNRPKGCMSRITPLLPFEMYLLNDGFEMISFAPMNALEPNGRIYSKDGKEIVLAFGLTIDDRRTNFFYSVNNDNYYQVDNNIDNYIDAINSKLKPLLV